jgi:hypothetical protein
LEPALGSHDPHSLDQKHTYSRSFTYASYLVNGANVMTRAELLALTHALENQADEDQAVYFDMYIIEVHGNRTPQEARASRSWLTPSWPTRASWDISKPWWTASSPNPAGRYRRRLR